MTPEEAVAWADKQIHGIYKKWWRDRSQSPIWARPSDLLDLLDPDDRLDAGDALGHDAMDRLRPDALVVDLVVPQIARGRTVLVRERPRGW